MRRSITWPLVQNRLLEALRYVVLYGSALIIVFPILWIASTSFKTREQVTEPNLLPNPITFDNYAWVLEESPFLLHLRNSVILAAEVMVVSVVLGSMAAYGLARFRFAGRRVISRLVFLAYLVPTILLVVPIYITLSDLNILNTQAALVVADTAFVLPFCLTLLVGFFEGIPRELEEAALVDGCSKLQAFRHILFPLAAPGIMTAAMFAWVLAWNEFLFALTMVHSDGLKTLPIHLSWYRGPSVGFEVWGPMQAEAMLYSLPVILIFLWLQRYLAEGIMGGAVKG
jgi:multiple sugar transport system permease protein